jgi:hypothetical protein
MCSKYDNHSRLNNEHNGRGGALWPSNAHGNPHFDSNHDIHMSSKNYQESGYNFVNLDLLIIAYRSRLSYPSEKKKEANHSIPIYLIIHRGKWTTSSFKWKWERENYHIQANLSFIQHKSHETVCEPISY